MLEFILFIAVSIQQPSVSLDGFDIVSADEGDLVVLAPPSETEARFLWNVQGDFEGYAVDDTSGKLYLSMPAKDVMIDLVMAPNDLDQRISIKRYRIQFKGDPEPEPEPTPEPTPDSYDGPNDYGMGEFTWNQSAGWSMVDVDMSKTLFDMASGHLYGRGGVKFIGSEDPSDSSDNVFFWLRGKLPASALPIVDELEKKKKDRMNLAQWSVAFGEVVSALEARQ